MGIEAQNFMASSNAEPRQKNLSSLQHQLSWSEITLMYLTGDILFLVIIDQEIIHFCHK